MIIDDKSLSEFLVKIHILYGADFIHYNYTTLKRRIEVHAIKLNFEDFEQYKELILNDKIYFDQMFSYFSINVTEFFREPEQLKLFREHIVPYLKTFPYLKIWCAGCSSGESPYSLAIILCEEGLLDKAHIYATDFNHRILSQAKKALFSIEHIEQSRDNYIKSGGKEIFDDYFIKKGKYYKVKRFLQEKILFCNHNLVTDGVINEFQLIICKNVIIYFDKILKNKVISLFDSSLECNGFLILGNSELLPIEFKDKFDKYIPHSKVYHKQCK